jgi:hypothetical protein
MHKRFAACHDVADAKAGSGGCACHAGALAQAGQPQILSSPRPHAARTEVISLTIFHGAAERCVNRGNTA